MGRLPIVPHYEAGASRRDEERVHNLAAKLLAEQPDLVAGAVFGPLRLRRYGDAPTLHLDDLSAIPLLTRYYDVSFCQDRARFRAYDGDIVASCGSHVTTFERYCEDRLRLGHITWLHPRSQTGPLAVAKACWTDRDVREHLVEALRRGRLRCLHPHMGTFAVWATALLLSRASGRRLRVVAPPPELTTKVNNKLWFADVVQRLFGGDAIPNTVHAWNQSALARCLHELAPLSRMIVVKRPDSAGGAGNLVLDSRRCRGLSLGELRRLTRSILNDLGWRGEVPLLVGSWETEVLCTPSVQLWVPPQEQDPPIVEGIYLQSLEGPRGNFVGSRPCRLPSSLEQSIVNRSWLVASLFQELGYVGRCSFDLLLVGSDFDDCRLEFVECNGRWGGASLPMTLMNRLFGDWAAQPYAHREFAISGLDSLRFVDILTHFGDDLFDAATRRGRFVLYNPRALAVRPGLDCLAFGDSWADAARRLRLEFPSRLLALLAEKGPAPTNASNGHREALPRVP